MKCKTSKHDNAIVSYLNGKCGDLNNVIYACNIGLKCVNGVCKKNTRLYEQNIKQYVCNKILLTGDGQNGAREVVVGDDKLNIHVAPTNALGIAMASSADVATALADVATASADVTTAVLASTAAGSVAKLDNLTTGDQQHMPNTPQLRRGDIMETNEIHVSNTDDYFKKTVNNPVYQNLVRQMETDNAERYGMLASVDGNGGSGAAHAVGVAADSSAWYATGSAGAGSAGAGSAGAGSVGSIGESRLQNNTNATTCMTFNDKIKNKEVVGARCGIFNGNACGVGRVCSEYGWCNTGEPKTDNEKEYSCKSLITSSR